ncbi:MAG: DUF3078 domain-containing protein [Prolixibacteraceae bacterium]|jgi:hypothetical protein|nr:DUF3078 domain-containing protein [Bacteroidota bacterium]NLS98668.1 DUF3078 domain-containing protein [Bacteroidales bacterium]HNZ68428.1 DUF3078 domain-containing protein [Prolixibacteraceae bacterium]HOC86279.1 DUF3078 domain-containing protein [Prolixibacteraceae bacterium]HOG95548.1 DUF3078 domain-containing protein [Prolixibacteraceae bacterium]
MRKLILSFVTLYFVLGMTAQEVQDTTYWKKNGDFTVNFSQVSFSNWAAGGKNSVSGVALFNYGANYLKDRLSWDNSLNLGYGLLKEGSDELIKSEDKMEFNSKAGYRMAPESKWFFSGLLGFRSQFANGYKYPDTDNRISALFAPAYLNFALGADYKPSDRFSLFLSPLGSKFTFVADDVLAPLFGLETGKNMRAELGGTLRSELKLPLVTNVDMVAALGLFSNYLEKPQNVDVNWDLRINMKINKFLSANLITNMIYDDNIKIDGKNSLVQWKQLFGVGFSYKF